MTFRVLKNKTVRTDNNSEIRVWPNWCFHHYFLITYCCSHHCFQCIPYTLSYINKESVYIFSFTYKSHFIAFIFDTINQCNINWIGYLACVSKNISVFSGMVQNNWQKIFMLVLVLQHTRSVILNNSLKF